MLAVVVAAAPSLARAERKVAVAPLDGDDDGKITGAVVHAAEPHATLTGPETTQKALDALSLSSLDSPKALRKVRKKLGVDVVLHGKVERAGTKRKLVLAISGPGKKEQSIELKFKPTGTAALRKELRDALADKLGDGGGAAEGDEPDEDETRPKDRDKDAERDKPRDRDKDAERDKPRDKDRTRDDSERPKSRATASASASVSASSDDEPRHKKRHHRGDEPPPRHPVTQDSLWVDAGFVGQHRGLTYNTNANGTPPPPVGTASFAAEVDGEVYPAAFDSLQSVAAGLGIAGAFGKTIGLSIHVPGSNVSAPIDESHYSIGARYRFVFGQSSVAGGVAYWRQRYIADRSSLMGATLDMPDVDYQAIAPGAIAKFAATPTIGISISVDVPLMVASGAITSMADYGAASVIAFVVQGGVDVALAQHYGLHFAAWFDQVGLKFTNAPRGLTGATDRTIGASATFAVIY